MKKLIELYNALSARDRNAVRLILAFSPVLVYLVLAQPLYQFYQQSRLAFQESRALSIWMRENQGNISLQPDPSVAAPDSDLIQTLSSVAESTGISIDRLQPQGKSGVSVWFQEVEFGKLILWLTQLRDKNMVIDSISINKTAKAGIVSVQCSLTSGS